MTLLVARDNFAFEYPVVTGADPVFPTTVRTRGLAASTGETKDIQRSKNMTNITFMQFIIAASSMP